MAAPLTDNKKFCQDCKQKNKGNNNPFESFIDEVFNWLCSLDGKFRNILIPLLTKLKVISRNYIDRKKTMLLKPFSLLFNRFSFIFLLLGRSKSSDKFEGLKNGIINNKSNIISLIMTIKLKKMQGLPQKVQLIQSLKIL